MNLGKEGSNLGKELREGRKEGRNLAGEEGMNLAGKERMNLGRKKKEERKEGTTEGGSRRK